MAPELPLSPTPLLAALDALTRDTAPEEHVDYAALAPDLRREAEQAHQLASSDRTIREQQVQQLQQEETTMQTALQEMEQEQEAVPALPSYRRAWQALRLTGARPMYLDLAWHPALQAQTRHYLEETIGEEILGAFLVDPASVDAARQILFPDYPGLRLCRHQQPSAPLPEWIRQSFDLSASSPYALACLALEMTAEAKPYLEAQERMTILRFRAHTRRLAGTPARLIGEEARRKAWKEQVDRQRAALQDQRQKIRTARAELAKRSKICQALAAFLEAFERVVRELARAHGKQARQQREAYQTSFMKLQTAQETLARLREENAARAARLAGIEARIEAEGLEQLHKRIARLERELHSLEQQHDDHQHRKGAIAHEEAQLETAMEQIAVECREVEQRRQHAALCIRQATGVEDVPQHVLKTHRGEQYAREDKVEARQRALELEETRQATALSEKIAHPTFGAVFTFAYDREANQLCDRRGMALPQVAEEQRKAIAHLREVLERENIELFETIIRHELVGELRKQITRLDDMVNTTNRNLAGRWFGNSQYEFRVRTVEEYQKLVEIIRKANLFRVHRARRDARFLPGVQTGHSRHEPRRYSRGAGLPELVPLRVARQDGESRRHHHRSYREEPGLRRRTGGAQLPAALRGGALPL